MMEARRCTEQALWRRGGGGASQGLWWLVCGRLRWCVVVAEKKMVVAGVAGEGGVHDSAVGCEKKMVAPPLLQIGGGRRGDGGGGCHGDGRRWRLGFGRLKVMTWQHVIG